MSKTQEDLIFSDLKLLPGTKLDIRSEQYSSLKGFGSYVGLQGNSIVVGTPFSNGKPIACKPNTQVVIRFFVNHLNCACAFRSEITHTATAPFAHLFIAVPEKMEVGEVRSSVRANVKLSCKVTSHAEYRKPNQPAILDNLSVEGAKMLSKGFIGDEGEEVTITTKISVLDMEKVVYVKGVIRSSADADGQFSYGIQFIDIDQTVKLLVYAYVMSQIKG
ncbi:MAG: flagellar brake domain-containing protein [Cellvibrionaceae bacterium]